MSLKIIVAHPEQQHSYRLATAIEQKGYLSTYATTVYYKKYNFTYWVSKLLKGSLKKRAENRHCDQFPQSKVKQFCECRGLCTLVAIHNAHFKKWYFKLKYSQEDWFAKKVARFAIKEKADVVITYSQCSPILFEILEKKAPEILRVLDVPAANKLYMKEIYERDKVLAPAFSKRLDGEKCIVRSPEEIDRNAREMKAAEHFIIPSEFVKRSLAFSGIRPEQMHLCPYGVDLSQFSKKEYRKIGAKDPVEFIYVGGVKELKGIYYLLEAFKRIPSDKAHLTVVGIFNPEDEDVKPYVDKVSFTGFVLHDDVPELLKKSDVFVFPSLGEGLSLSTLEAAACGLPLIVSENSGVNDGMTEGKEGFVIPIQSVDAICEKVEWFVENKDQIEEMGNNARNFALGYSWEKYYETIGKIVDEELFPERD